MTKIIISPGKYIQGNGECLKVEINRLRDKFKEINAEVVIAIGGGKIRDTLLSEGLNIKKVSNEKLMEVANLSCEEGETIHNMPFKVTAKDVYAAILTADVLGKEL